MRAVINQDSGNVSDHQPAANRKGHRSRFAATKEDLISGIYRWISDVCICICVHLDRHQNSENYKTIMRDSHLLANDAETCILVSIRTCKTICALETPFTCEFWQILMRSRLYCTSDLIQSLEQIIIIPFEFNQVSQIFRITLFLLAEQIRSEMWFSDLFVLWTGSKTWQWFQPQSISTETEICWHWYCPFTLKRGTDDEIAS